MCVSMDETFHTCLVTLVSIYVFKDFGFQQVYYYMPQNDFFVLFQLWTFEFLEYTI